MRPANLHKQCSAKRMVSCKWEQDPPFRLRKNAHFSPACRLDGTPGRNRTCDPLFRRQLLYPLSYEGISLDSTKPLSG